MMPDFKNVFNLVSQKKAYRDTGRPSGRPWRWTPITYKKFNKCRFVGSEKYSRLPEDLTME